MNSGINGELRAPIKDMQVYNETFGFEKTFWDRQASIGFRIPLNTLTIDSSFPGLSGSHTSTGNFSSFFKYILWEDDRGDLLSGGLTLDFPTGPRSFAGYPTILGINAFEIQPFLGYIYMLGDRGFRPGVHVHRRPHRPEARHHVLRRHCAWAISCTDPRILGPCVSAIVPTFETHLNIPLNFAGFQPRYIGSTPDVIDLTYAVNVGFASRAVISTAYVHSVTGPTPFSGELALMLNVPFGGRPGRNLPLTPPVVGR